MFVRDTINNNNIIAISKQKCWTVCSDELKCATSVYCSIKVHDRYKVFLHQWAVMVVDTFPANKHLTAVQRNIRRKFNIPVGSNIYNYQLL